jgi:tetratricopeptide (TPR) repeat protein
MIEEDITRVSALVKAAEIEAENERVAARVEQQRQDARTFERAQHEWDEGGPPLRRRLLEALLRGPATPTTLAALTGAAKPSISRVLRSMLDDELVQIGEVEGDARRRLYALTREGEARLSRQRAFGGPAAPPEPPMLEERARFLAAAVRNAVRMRREANDLEGAADRLQIVRTRTQRFGLDELELEAIVELATTFRQGRHIEQMHALLGSLEDISLGRHPNGNPTLALPATAHREYTLGRLPEQHGGSDADTRARHLDTAQSLYAQLAHSSRSEQASGWRIREAWSIVSLASNLRQRSHLEEALEKTVMAMSVFDELGDPYGQSHCLFMLGFCQRLMGDFDEASLRLSQAEKLASSHAYRRFQADALMQMGEVRRCQGEITEAQELLSEAFDRSERMNVVVTQAFAKSALGAVAYEQGRLPEAQTALEAADRLFEAARHGEGHALNDRRRAAVARRLGLIQGRHQLHAARRFALKALERYVALRSPAGMAACEIETGRLELMTPGGHVDKQVAGLIERLDDTRQLNLLELDPWVPKVLVNFADEIGNLDLGERATELVRDGQRRLAAWTSKGVVGRAAGQRATETGRPGSSDRGASFDMGGEARIEDRVLA